MVKNGAFFYSQFSISRMRRESRRNHDDREDGIRKPATEKNKETSTHDKVTVEPMKLTKSEKSFGCNNSR